MNDNSWVRGNLLWCAISGDKRNVNYWQVPLIMLIFFGLMTIASVYFILVGGYVPRLVDWGWVALYMLGAVGMAFGLWWEWRKRRGADQAESDSLNKTYSDSA